MAKPKRTKTKAGARRPAKAKPAKAKPAKAKPAKAKPAKAKPAKAKPAKAKPAKPALTGGDTRWWDLIERSRKEVSDRDEQADRLVALMTAELSADDIVVFDKFLQERVRDAFRSDLWGIAYIMNGGCSDDGFDYFLGWLICKGKKHYEAALANPEAAAKGVSPEDEPFENEVVYWGPSRAWAAKTGKPSDEYYKLAPSVQRTLKGELFDEDTIYDDYPKLKKKFLG
jgi:hypothetical protein